MKLTDLAIIFVILAFPFILLLKFKSNDMESLLYKKTILNRVIDTAIEDGTALLVEIGDDKKIRLCKNRAVQSFYNTLFINLGILGDEINQQKIKCYIPVIAIIDYNGIYILSNEEYADIQDNKLIKQTWKAKKTYSKASGDYVVNFTLGKEVTINNTANGKLYKNTYNNLKGVGNISFIDDDTLFEKVRMRTIIETIKRELNYAINNHNDIARQFGISYNFTLPVIKEEDWYNTINDVSMLVFIQGFPMGIRGKKYNNFALGGAKVVKPVIYYIQTNAISGIKYYHKGTCENLRVYDMPERDKISCAKKGAIPCHICKP
ncbi:hypothetical protein PV797_04465 [Clostridiaceae bacterium M8S5]|nr:hypothetical protein PV797_04465 [Clostridiaceae bacterium M8S5]